MGGLCRDVNHFLLGEIERKINRIKIYFNFCQWGMLEEGEKNEIKRSGIIGIQVGITFTDELEHLFIFVR